MAEPQPTTCAVCKKSSGENTKLLQCARCKNRYYCGQECQKNDWKLHKDTCKRPNYLLKFHLHPEDIVDPPIHRTLSCPSTATFDDLHRALQIAFGWASTHTYDFKVKDPVAEAAFDAEQASLSQSESMLRLMQSVMKGDGTENKQLLLRIVDDDPHGAALRSHMHAEAAAESGIPGIQIGHGIKVDAVHGRMRFNPKTPQKKGSKVRLFQVLDDVRFQGKPFEYEYDFGDCWEHEITLAGRKDATNVFTCVDGEGHACAEDVGSKTGWLELMTAFKAPRPTKDQKEKMRWFKNSASNGDPSGLGNGRDRLWPKETINTKLAALKIV